MYKSYLLSRIKLISSEDGWYKLYLWKESLVVLCCYVNIVNKCLKGKICADVYMSSKCGGL